MVSVDDVSEGFIGAFDGQNIIFLRNSIS